MKKFFALISLIFVSPLWAFDPDLYQDQFRRLTLAMQFSSDQVMRSDEYEAPKGVYELRQFFLKLCSPNSKGNQDFEYIKRENSELLVFTCDEVKKNSLIQGWRFSALINSDNKLLHLDVDKVASDQGRLEFSEGLKVTAALGAGLLASSFFSRSFYPNQDDKLLHFYAGDLIGAGGMFISYYGLKLNKDKSLLVGLSLGILAGLAKEFYDSRHPNKHVKDKNDALATFMGTGLGVGTLRLAFEF